MDSKGLVKTLKKVVELLHYKFGEILANFMAKTHLLFWTQSVQLSIWKANKYYQIQHMTCFFYIFSKFNLASFRFCSFVVLNFYRKTPYKDSYNTPERFFDVGRTIFILLDSNSLLDWFYWKVWLFTYWNIRVKIIIAKVECKYSLLSTCTLLDQKSLPKMECLKV